MNYSSYNKKKRYNRVNLRRIRPVCFLCSCAMLINLNACMLLPEEKLGQAVPIIPSFEVQDYVIEEVTRGDVISKAEVLVTYTQIQESDLRFGISGRVVKMNVALGDYVKEGDLLAQMDVSEFTNQLHTITEQEETAHRSLTNNFELYELELKKARIKLNHGWMNQKEYNEIETHYHEKKAKEQKAYDNLIYLNVILKEDLNKAIEERSIYAPFDGLIKFEAAHIMYRFVDVNQNIYKIIDDTECIFKGSTEFAAHFNEGQSIEVLIGESTYQTTVAKSENENELVLKLDDITEDLNVGVRGKCTVIFEEIKDVLRLSSLSVHKANDQYYVNVINENGYKEVKEIEVGLASSYAGFVEIKAGLSEGDEVIKK